MAEIPTRDLLARALRDNGAPGWIVTNATSGYYDDYDSPLDAPITQLVRDLQGARMADMAQRAIDGEFDATVAESQAWAASPEGLATYKDFNDALKNNKEREH